MMNSQLRRLPFFNNEISPFIWIQGAAVHHTPELIEMKAKTPSQGPTLKCHHEDDWFSVTTYK